MATHDLGSDVLERRRRELGMSRTVLARRSGISLATIHRILNGDIEHVTIAKVRAVSQALGVELVIQELGDARQFKEKQALRKARELIALVQGSSALEAQGVESDIAHEMIQQTVHELMAGSKRRLWG
jgi:transcriptional regulator with XRE-family HTH domain